MVAWRWTLWWTLGGCTWGGTTGSTACEPPGTQVTSPRAAGCLVIHDGALLLVQNPAGDWSIPAGYVSAGESGGVAAVRETREEAGVLTTAGSPYCAVTAKGFVAYHCSVDADASPRADGVETQAARWVTADTLRSLPLRFEAQRPAYLEALVGRP